MTPTHHRRQMMAGPGRGTAIPARVTAPWCPPTGHHPPHSLKNLEPPERKPAMSGMSQNLSVEHGAVTSHVASLQANHQTLQTQSNQFMTAIEPLQNSWKGTSVAAWENMTQAWRDNMEQVNTALEELTGRVDEAGKAYQAGEDDQASMLQQKFAGMNFQQGNIL